MYRKHYKRIDDNTALAGLTLIFVQHSMKSCRLAIFIKKNVKTFLYM